MAKRVGVIPPELVPLAEALRTLIPELHWHPRADGGGLEYRSAGVCVQVSGDVHAQTLDVVCSRDLYSEAAELGVLQLRRWVSERLPFLVLPGPVVFMPAHATAWHRFRETGLLWWLNRSLHLFGWAIVVAYDDTGENVIAVYPERVMYRGFSPRAEEQGFQRLTHYLKREAPHLVRDLEEDSHGA